MTLIQPNGDEVDFWLLGVSSNFTGGQVLCTGNTSCGIVVYENATGSGILGSGVPPHGSATSGASGAAGLNRFDELARGVIPHAIAGGIPCVNGTPVYPGTSQATLCADGQGIPIGSHIQFTMTDAQITALKLPSWAKAVLTQWHDYGFYVTDTSSGVESTFKVVLGGESYTQYAAYGQPYPGIEFAKANGFSYDFVNQVYNGDLSSWPPLRDNVRVVSPCYAQQTCKK
jgi:hypothetical protein